MTSPHPSNLTVFDLFRSIKKSPIYFAFWFLLILALVIAAYIVLPRKYFSEGKLYVQVGRSSVGSAPDTGSKTISIQDSRETEVRSVVELLSSRELAERVVDIIGVDRILRPNSEIERMIESLPELELGGGSSTASEGDDALSPEEFKALKRKNAAVKRLMKRLKVESEKKTTVISVKAIAQTPYLAKDIAEAYLKEYQKKHVEVNRRQTSNFFESRLQLHEQRLSDSESALEAFRTKLNILDVQSARNLLQKEIDQLRLERLNTSVLFSAAVEKSKQMAERFAKIPAFIEGADTRTSSLARDKAREALYALQLQESDLASRYNDSNPRLMAIRNTIKKAERELEQIPESFQESEKNINVAHQEILVEVTNAGAEAKAFETQLKQVDELIALKNKEVNELNKALIKENKLQRQIDINRVTLMKIADRRSESETIGALDSEEISNVRIAQQPTLILKKTFPSGLMFGALALLASFSIATIMTYFREYRPLSPIHNEAEPQPTVQPILQPQTIIHSYHGNVEAPARPAPANTPPTTPSPQQEAGETVTLQNDAQSVVPSRNDRSGRKANLLVVTLGFAVLVVGYLLMFLIK